MFASLVDPRRRTRQSVRFRDQVHVYPIPSRRQLSKEELQEYYMTDTDRLRILGEIKGCLKKEVRGEEFRGLERVEPRALRDRRRRTHLALQAVLRQQMEGELSEEWLTRSYRGLTAAAAADAYRRGLMDQLLHEGSPPPLPVMSR